LLQENATKTWISESGSYIEVHNDFGSRDCSVAAFVSPFADDLV